MAWRGRRRGFFEGPPRVLYRRAGRRYIDGAAAAIVLNGIAVALFGLVVVALYVDVRAGEIAGFAAVSAAGYVVENVIASVYLRRVGAPIRDGASLQAWSAAARLPLALVRSPSLYVIGAGGAAASALVLAALLDRPAGEAALLFPVLFLLYISSAVMRYIGLELAMRPLLEDLGGRLPEASLRDVE